MISDQYTDDWCNSLWNISWHPSYVVSFWVL